MLGNPSHTFFIIKQFYSSLGDSVHFYVVAVVSVVVVGGVTLCSFVCRFLGPFGAFVL